MAEVGIKELELAKGILGKDQSKRANMRGQDADNKRLEGDLACMRSG